MYVEDAMMPGFARKYRLNLPLALAGRLHKHRGGVQAGYSRRQRLRAENEEAETSDRNSGVAEGSTRGS